MAKKKGAQKPVAPAGPKGAEADTAEGIVCATWGGVAIPPEVRARMNADRAAAEKTARAKEHLCPTGERRKVARPAKATTLVVYRALPVNRRIVEAHPPGKPQQIKVVRVQDNANFMRGMVLEARHVAGQTFELVGGLPRWRGKWGLPGKVDLWRPPVEQKLTPAELKTQLRAKYGREGELI